MPSNANWVTDVLPLLAYPPAELQRRHVCHNLNNGCNDAAMSFQMQLC